MRSDRGQWRLDPVPTILRSMDTISAANTQHQFQAPGSQARAEALKVFLVDDSAALRSRIAGMVREIEGVDIVGEAEIPDQATSGILESAPDAVLLDLKLTGGTGIDVLKAVHPAHPGIVFIILTNHAGRHYQRACMASGASYFLDKSHDFKQIATILGALRSIRCRH